MKKRFGGKTVSEIMRSIKGANTKPEITIRRFLFANGFRYRLHDRSLPGSPDIKLTKYKTVIFVNGCFWHGHGPCYKEPKRNSKFWTDKVTKNKDRDTRNILLLKELGWNVIVIWECELKRAIRDATYKNILQLLLNNYRLLNR